MLASNTLSDLELETLPCAISSESITLLNFIYLDAQSIEFLFLSQLPSLEVLAIQRLCIDDPHYTGYGRLRNTVSIAQEGSWEGSLLLHNDQQLPCSLYCQAVEQMILI